MPCLNEEELLTFLHGEPTSEQIRRIDAHIDGCPSCHELLMVLSSTDDTATADTPAPDSGNAAERDATGRIGRYILLDLLGAGGMGVVYSAYDPELERKVALKLLRSEQIERGRERLRREAQALARLAHPNVVSLHDVGEHKGRIFLVMEFVEGMTLGEWLATSTAGWRARLALLLQAGRGLQAAHAAGLVHRDFKPSNVLVDRQGRARVLDFGLARAVGDSARQAGVDTGPTAAVRPSAHPAHGDQAPLAQLTNTGTVLGTPVYMAPEQYARRIADAATDQFSFCVVLYEALYGQKPFAGDTLEQLADAITAGQVRPPPREACVPAFVQQAVRRGLSVAPEARFPSMEALLTALQRDPRAALPRAAGALVVAALFALGVAAAHRAGRQQAAQCDFDPRQLQGVWDETRAGAIRAAFLRTGKPYAETSFRSAKAALDDYVARWVSMRRDACLATRARGEQSAELLDLRMQCLDERRKGVAALTELFGRADGQVVERAVAAAYQLAPLADCADARGLLGQVPLPRDAGQRAQIQALRSELAEAQAFKEAGKYAEGLRRAEGLLPRARQLAHPPLVGDALLLLGGLQLVQGAAAAAEATFNAALWNAVASGEDKQAFAATNQLLRLHAERQHFTLAESSAHYAEAVLQRLGGDVRLAADLEHHRAILALQRGEYLQAERGFQRVYDYRAKMLPPGDPSVAAALHGLASAARGRGDIGRHLAINQQLLARLQASLGSEHPTIAVLEESIGTALWKSEDPAAFAHYRRSLAIRQRVLPPGHPLIGDALSGLTPELTTAGRYAEAADNLRRVLDLFESALGHDHHKVEVTLLNLAALYLEWNKPDLAAPYATEALAIAQRLYGARHVEVANALSILGELALARRDYAQAIAKEEAALAMFHETIGTEEGIPVDALRVVGQAYLRCAQPAKAADALARAVKQGEHLAPYPSSRAATQLSAMRAQLSQAQAALSGPAKSRTPAAPCPGLP